MAGERAGTPPWRVLGGRALHTSAPFGLMGIVNITPDSFFDGGEHGDARLAVAHALRLRDEGADILELGAESSRPGAPALTSDEEMRRLLPVLCDLRTSASGVCLSVDTYHASTAEAVLRCGASIINDISGCAYDPALLDVLAQYRPGYVLMHCQGRPATMQKAPRYDDVRRDVLEFFDTALNRLVRAGLPEDRIALDPGIGFGKTLENNYELMNKMGDFREFDLPILVGISRKSMIYKLVGGTPADALGGTIALNTIALERGAHILRVHDVKAAVETVKIVEALQATSANEE